MSETVRGLIVFVAALITIALWVPLRNRPERLPDGVIVTETYFGAFRYLTLRTELKEPEYKMSWHANYPRMAVTGLSTAVLWTGVIAAARKRTGICEPPSNQTEPTESSRSRADRSEP